MPQDVQILKPQILNLDKSKKYLGGNEAFYLLNHEVNTNGSTDSLGQSTPLIANYQACELEQPLGENYSIGGFESQLTSEDYDFVYNSNESHYIKRIDSNGICEIVYHGDCLKLSAEPKHSIEKWRCYMKIDKLCKNAHGKQIVWTDGLNPIGQIDVEASIATNFFTTPFFDVCPDPCAYIQMCVPKPCDVITAEYIAYKLGDEKLNNKIFNRTFQFIYRHVYYDGRASEWSNTSTMYVSDTGICLETVENTAARCMRLRINIGNPLVEKIEIGFREDNNPQWYLYDTIEKYNPYTSSVQYWYERTLSPAITSSNFSECSFDYIFCNDKDCQTIDVNQTNRVYNPMPIEPQGLIPFNDSLAFYNYKQGNCPLSKNEIDKFEIKPVYGLDNCKNELVPVVVRAVISTYTAQSQFVLFPQNQVVFRAAGNYGDLDDDSDDALFGGFEELNSGQGIGLLQIGFGQIFSNKRRNFTVYIEGTDYHGEMEQWMAKTGFTQRVKVGIVSGGSLSGTYSKIRYLLSQGYFFYQEYTFYVPKGTRGIIRIANQDHEPGYHDNTSARIGILHTGLIDISTYIINSSVYRNGGNSIEFDACDGGFDTLACFEVIAVSTTGTLVSSRFSFNGHILDKRGRRVEYLEVWVFRPGLWKKECITDHNGFFAFDTYGQQEVQIEIRGELSTTGPFQVIGTYILSGVANDNVYNILTVQNLEYTDKSYAIVRIPVLDCNYQAVAGVRVAMLDSKYVVTENGVAEFILRQSPERNRNIRFYIMDARGCFSYGCFYTCNACMPYGGWTFNSTFFTTPIQEFDLNFFPQNRYINTKYISSSVSGLKSGGKYPLGFVLEGDCGKISAVNELPDLVIPKIQERGDLSFALLQYNSNNIELPLWVKCLHIVRGENINKYELQWVVDKIERIENNTKIKLTIQSLNDYNAQYLFNTNTKYQWIKGDRVEFIRNGNNEIFDFANNKLLVYKTISPLHDITLSGQTDAPADYFNQLLIDNDGDLDDLTEGAIIELQREKECTDEPVYFSIGVTLPVVNGRLLNPTGIFHTFDTYLVKRTVSGRTLQLFEHHSPTDFWGDHVTDIGKAYFRNKYENEKRYGRAVTINSRTQFNYFSDIVKGLPNPEHGDVTSMNIVDNKVIAVISEKDNCVLTTSDELLRFNSQGVVTASPADELISDPQPKLSGVFGCKYEDIGSIYYGDGWFTYVDSSKNAYVKHTYDKAVDISEGKLSTYFRKRCQQVMTFNLLPSQINPADPLRFLNHLKYVTGFNNHTGAVQLTIKSLRDSAINNEIEPFLKNNETLLFSPIAEQFLTFASYTPERYSNLDLSDENGCSMILFYNTTPWVHPIIAIDYNSFFGVSVDRVLGVVMNKFIEKVKSPLAIEIQDESMWFVKKLETDKPNVLSEIPPVKFKKDGRKWNGAFLKNINSVGGLYNGQPLNGFWSAITFVRDNTINNQYNTVNSDKQKSFDELDNILIKFMLQEQSGFTENI